ncbi:enolase-phosphatase E1 [Kitasatospora sp. MAP12-15]|uniref:acireductone synthase n=1 Tax=unclassified Kitasatospora TaxID=2633591 RepID=UPI002473179E|nr:acireductone synthase [Kitasatospora sp. MAP12-44]MDH6109384.1 enolase-phosphatase E1 [Kitasatospora sp. MAP12-44]
MIGHVVLDIEGTTSSLSHVRDVLFPYARRRLRDWLELPLPDVAAVVAEVRERTGRPAASLDEVHRVLLDWLDRDVKAPPLKTLQGLIWQQGYAAGELSSQVYEDVPPALRRWREQGAALHVYSSGSVLAQREWFRHTGAGDLREHFTQHFDTRSPGSKTEPGSYREIAARLAAAPDGILFCSDHQGELDAARAAGLRTLGVRRPDGSATPLAGHRVVGGFDGLDLTTLEAQ